MATPAKRQLAISTALTKELTELALRESKSVQAFLRDLLTEHKRHRLKVKLEKLQNYWSKKAKANDLRTLRSLKGVLKGMSTDNIREKPHANGVRVVRRFAKQDSPFAKGRKVVEVDAVLDKARALRQKQRSVHVTDDLIKSIKRK